MTLAFLFLTLALFSFNLITSLALAIAEMGDEEGASKITIGNVLVSLVVVTMNIFVIIDLFTD